MAAKSLQKPYRILPPATWKQIRHQYEAGHSPTLLCEQYKISQSTFFSRRNREGWVLPGSDHGPGTTETSEVTLPRFSDLDAESGNRAQDPRSPCEQFPRQTGKTVPQNCEPVPSGLDSTSESHLSMAQVLKHRIDRLAADERLGSGPQGRMSRAVVDLATAVEKLQRIERKALGMDTGAGDVRQQVVIIVPQKLSEEDWKAKAQELRSS